MWIGWDSREQAQNWRTVQACVVPVAVCKSLQVAANLALPRDVAIRIAKE